MMARGSGQILLAAAWILAASLESCSGFSLRAVGIGPHARSTPLASAGRQRGVCSSMRMGLEDEMENVKDLVLKKIEGASLSSEMSDAVARAIEKADLLLEETKDAPWRKRQEFEASAEEQLQMFRSKVELSRSEESEDSDDEEESKGPNPYTEMMEECASRAQRGEAGRKEGWAVLKEMEQFGIVPNHETFTSLVKVLAKAAKHGNAKAKHGDEVIAEMRARGLEPTAVTASLLLSLYARDVMRGGDVSLDKAWAVVKDVGSGGDEYVYAGLMDVCAKLSMNGKAGMRDAEKIISHMDASGVKGDVYVWNSMVQVCVHSLKNMEGGTTFEDAVDLLGKMTKHDVEPDHFTFSLLFSAAARAVQTNQTKADGAISLLKACMKKSGVAPNLVVYNSILSVYVKAAELGQCGAEAVRGMLKDLERDRIVVDRTFYGSCMALLAGASLHGKANGKDAKELIDHERQAGIAPSSETYRLWIKVLANCALVGESSATQGLGALKYMKSVGTQVTPSIYATLMDHVSRAALFGKGSVLDADKILEEMRDNEVPLTETILCCYLQVAKGDGKRSSAIKAFNTFASTPTSIRSQRAYTLLIACLSRAGQRKTAFALIDVLRATGAKPNMYVYNAALQAAPDAASLLALHAKMEEEGVAGDKVTRKLVNGAKRGRVWVPKKLPPETAQRLAVERATKGKGGGGMIQKDG